MFDPLKAYKTNRQEPKEYLKGKESLKDYQKNVKDIKIDKMTNSIRNTILDM